MELQHLYHLYNRAGFGISIKQAKKLQADPVNKAVEQLFLFRGKESPIAMVQKNELPSRQQIKAMSEEERSDSKKMARDKLQSLNTAWMRQFVSTPAPLLEKMTLFWHGHFACRVENPFIAQQLNNIQRQFAFASFKELLVAVSQSPAMLQFLNNQQNHKEHPNENFARELMELFTIGRGNYSEQDIKESARAFTGWVFNENYEFEFRARAHDEGSKIFMGQTGHFTGEDIIDIILKQKATATFLCTKIYKFFVNESPDPKIIASLSDFYFDSGYNTENLMRKIFTSDWFYKEENIGANIKSPVELLTGFCRSFGLTMNDELLLKLQRALGQLVFYPPNVAGWPGGKSWIDSSSLMLRLKLPSVLLNGGKIMVEEKDDMPEEGFHLPESITVNPDEKPFFMEASQEELIENLLRLAPGEEKKKILLQGNRSNRQLALKLVSMPEYQLC